MASLKKTILELETLENLFDTAISDSVKELVAKVVVELGQTTAYDTGLVRDLIANILMDLEHPELVDQIEYQVYEFWKTRGQREKEQFSYDVKVSHNNKNINYDIGIYDYGFAQQQDGKVSTIHPRRDKKVKAENVNYVLDLLETTGFKSEIRKLETRIKRIIEKGYYIKE